MRLEAVEFVGEGIGADRYARLARVLETSARQHCGGWQIRVSTVPVTPACGDAIDVRCLRKLDAWNGIVQQSGNGDELLLIDADTMILRPLDDVWQRPFDLAYTVRPRRPMNAGVMFLRISDRTKAFMAAWTHVTHDLVAAGQPVFRVGVDQVAFESLVTQVAAVFGISLLTLPCDEWNAEQHSWHQFDRARTRIVHVKSALRQAIFDQHPVTPTLAPLVERWHAIERRALVEVA